MSEVESLMDMIKRTVWSKEMIFQFTFQDANAMNLIKTCIQVVPEFGFCEHKIFLWENSCGKR